MSKGGFPFAAPGQIPTLLKALERDCLERWTPCHGLDDASLIRAIAITHVELILIHPFREGNGRLARLLVGVMATQAGHPPPDYSSWEAEKDRYIGAIHAGMGLNYAPMEQMVAKALNLS